LKKKNTKHYPSSSKFQLLLQIRVRGKELIGDVSLVKEHRPPSVVLKMPSPRKFQLQPEVEMKSLKDEYGGGDVSISRQTQHDFHNIYENKARQGTGHNKL
jgi:hypothetical protein